MIGAYNTGIEKNIINPETLSVLLHLKEAETTTRMEGTYVTLEEVVLSANKEQDTQERSNAREALGVRSAIERGKQIAEKRFIGTNWMKDVHKALMEHAALDSGTPGEFRKVRVRVGNHFPPEPQYVPELMSNLEKYIHNREEYVSPIVKTAIVHAQFEIIHPFTDGNGRVGRLLIPFLMQQYNLTNSVSFFVSHHIERHRSDYYFFLESITKRGDWEGWIDFFLRSVKECGEELMARSESLTDLYTDGDFLKFSGRSSQHLKNYIFSQPVFTIPDLIDYFKKNNMSLTNETGLHQVIKSSPDIEIRTQGRGRQKTEYECRKIMDILKV